MTLVTLVQWATRGLADRVRPSSESQILSMSSNTEFSRYNLRARSNTMSNMGRVSRTDTSHNEENLIDNNIFVTPKNDIQNLQEDNESISTVLNESCQWGRNKVTDWNKTNYNKLMSDQSITIEQAVHAMTDAQRELVETQNRYVNSIAIQRESNSRPSKDKGKGPDLCNWGNANLSNNDLDPEVQHQILEDCNK